MVSRSFRGPQRGFRGDSEGLQRTEESEVGWEVLIGFGSVQDCKTDRCTEIPHCVPRDIIPFRASALHRISENYKCTAGDITDSRALLSFLGSGPVGGNTEFSVSLSIPPMAS